MRKVSFKSNEENKNKSKGVLNQKKDATISLTGPWGAVKLVENAGDS